ncbi:MAG TPA: hypothetical protein VJC12_01170 [Candidatus Paceibacterota bacterium]
MSIETLKETIPPAVFFDMIKEFNDNYVKLHVATQVTPVISDDTEKVIIESQETLEAHELVAKYTNDLERIGLAVEIATTPTFGGKGYVPRIVFRLENPHAFLSYLALLDPKKIKKADKERLHWCLGFNLVEPLQVDSVDLQSNHVINLLGNLKDLNEHFTRLTGGSLSGSLLMEPLQGGYVREYLIAQNNYILDYVNNNNEDTESGQYLSYESNDFYKRWDQRLSALEEIVQLVRNNPRAANFLKHLVTGLKKKVEFLLYTLTSNEIDLDQLIDPLSKYIETLKRVEITLNQIT